MAKNWVRNPAAQMAASVPAGFFEDTLLAIRSANRTAKQHCKDLDPEWRLGAFANHRREHLNQLWAGIAARHGGRARAVLNGNNNSNHLEIEICGVVFTPVAVQSPGEFPRDADYRKSLATSNQATMFGKLGMEEEPAEDACLYGILVYSSAVDEDTDLPYFAHVGFPAPGAKVRKWVEAPFSLQQTLRDLGTPRVQVAPVQQPSDATRAKPAAELKEEVIAETRVKMRSKKTRTTEDE